MNAPIHVPLTPQLEQSLSDFTNAAKAACPTTLRSIVLYGSAADGTLRPASDVNVILVLDRFDPTEADRLVEPTRRAHVQINLTSMYLLESEIAAAARAFAEKFADILRRRRILSGPDPFANIQIPRTVELARLSQVLLNSVLRMRNTYVTRGQHEEQLSIAVAEAAGPLRADAGTLLELEGRPAASPKQALLSLAQSTALAGESDWTEILAHVSEARERSVLAQGTAKQTLLRLIVLAERMQRRVDQLAAHEGGI